MLWDLTFFLSSVDPQAVKIITNGGHPSNVAVPWGDVKEEVDFSIGLASVIPEQAGSTEETNSDEEFGEAQDSHTLAPRRANPLR